MKITIDLEKALMAQKATIIHAQELLEVREYEKHGDLKNDALSRVGLDSIIMVGKRAKKDIAKKAEQVSVFDQRRVFHITQIQSVCEKYYLKFLPTECYRGSVDLGLATKITNFEAAYNVKCSDVNTMICAPRESFQLEEKPKDPLFFYRINEDNFYLIHKWGNDLNLSRRVKSILSNAFITCLLIASFLILPFALHDHSAARLSISAIMSIAFSSVWVGLCIIIHGVSEGEDSIRLFRKNQWNKRYR